MEIDEPKPTAEQLEVESESAREQRMHNLFRKLNSPPAGVKSSPSFDFGDRKTHSVPQSDLISRVQAFLPQLEASNTRLAERVQTQGQQSVDIECLSAGIDQYIQMNLGLGVFEHKPATHYEPSSGSSSSSEDSDEESYDNDNDEDDDDSDFEIDIITSFKPPSPSERLIRPLPRRCASQSPNLTPKIVVLPSKGQES